MNDLASILQQANAGVGTPEAASALARNKQMSALITAFQALQAALEGNILGGVATTAYTPTVTAGTGTFTSVAATGRRIYMGKMTWFTAVVTITTNGTAGQDIRVTLPRPAASTTRVLLPGRRTAGPMLQGIIAVSAAFVTITAYDNSYPGLDGTVHTVSGWYEAA